MIRLVVNAFCLLSLIVSAAVVVLWLRSYRVGETWHLAPTTAPPADAAPLPGKPDVWLYQYHFASGNGQVQLIRRNMGTSDVKQRGYLRHDPPERALTHLQPGGNSGGSGWRFAQFEYFHSDRRTLFVGTMSAWMWGFQIVGVPLWLPALVFAVPPVVWLVRRRIARRRLRTGLCSGCGYDLRASREFGRCPECGRPAAALRSQATEPGRVAPGGPEVRLP